MSRPRVAICGIHIESSTFSPLLSTADEFQVARGEDLIRRYDWMDAPWAQRVDWLPVLHARALPGGVVDEDAYGSWKTEIVEVLRRLVDEMPLDGIFFDIHGAMSVQGLQDAEGDLIRSIREAVGDQPLVSASMDLHGNVSEDLFAGCDLLTCYRMAPHEDAAESRQRAAANLVDRIVSGAGKPAKALVHVPVLLPGEKTSTRDEPARSLYALVPEAEKDPGVLDAGIWIGFAWADQPRCTGAVVVTGDDAAAVSAHAQKLGEAFWDARSQFAFAAPVGSMEQCLEQALQGPRPFYISDSGDNPGAGGAGDVTYALDALLRWEPVQDGSLHVVLASMLDPEAVAACEQAGLGGEVRLDLGGHIDTRDPGPRLVRGVVTALAEDPRGGPTAVVRVGGLSIIVTSRRNQYAEREQYLAVGLDPRGADVVVVKMGYLEPDLHEAQAGWMIALTPGGVDQDIERLGHQHIERPMFPFDTGDWAVDLTPVVVDPAGTDV